MSIEEKKRRQEDENPAGYGGYITRHQYEKTKEKRKQARFRILSIALILLLSVPAALGIISLVRGDFFPDGENDPSGGDTVRVPTGTQLNENAKDPEKMIEELEVSLVTVALEKEDGSVSYGSGFVISEDGYILCSHSFVTREVIRSLRVYVDGISYNAKVAVKNGELGFAVLSLESVYGLIPVSTGNFTFVERGETLFAVGATYGNEFCGTALSGMVASVGQTVRVGEGEGAMSVPVAFLDLTPNASVYGAPVADAAGNVVGFLTDSVPSPYPSLAAVVPINVVYTLVNQMLGN